MNKTEVYDRLVKAKEERGGGFLLLIDPDKTHETGYLALCEAADDCDVDGILVGTSFMLDSNFATAVKRIKEKTSLPVIIFP